MTKKMRIWIMATTALALLALSLPGLVAAQHGAGRTHHAELMTKGHRAGAGQGERMAEALDLDEAQQVAVDAMRLEHRQAQVRMKGEIAGAEAELEALLLDPEASRAAVLAAGSKLAELRTKASTQRLEHRMDFRALLTPEQRTELVKMGSRRGGFSGPRGLHRGHGMHQGKGAGQHFRWFRGEAGGVRELDVEREVEAEGDRL